VANHWLVDLAKFELKIDNGDPVTRILVS